MFLKGQFNMYGKHLNMKKIGNANGDVKHGDVRTQVDEWVESRTDEPQGWIIGNSNVKDRNQTEFVTNSICYDKRNNHFDQPK